MTILGNGHDNSVKKLTNSYIPDLKSQEESTVPSYIEQSRGFAVADWIMKQTVQKNRMMHEVSSDNDDGAYSYDEDAISVLNFRKQH